MGLDSSRLMTIQTCMRQTNTNTTQSKLTEVTYQR